MPKQRSDVTIEFRATVDEVGPSAIVRLPAPASAELPSRGQVAVDAVLDGHAFPTVVEPDGVRGHWIRLEPALRNAAGVATGDDVAVSLTVSADWPEPQVPADLSKELSTAPTEVQQLWDEITPMARWEWVRWVNATANPATRQRRVEVTISKMDAGKRRPCCFDLSACTDPALSKSGKLIGATRATVSG